ncbi:hypothetical protein IQ07DRAFT_24709 [Pyrenochaeta sp. DS3sAY3a]|nr:hypothetical protein IQ07DRAFT_24709 [Pyrenochaeta sp. DS3sAY3a]
MHTTRCMQIPTEDSRAWHPRLCFTAKSASGMQYRCQGAERRTWNTYLDTQRVSRTKTGVHSIVVPCVLGRYVGWCSLQGMARVWWLLWEAASQRQPAVLVYYHEVLWVVREDSEGRVERTFAYENKMSMRLSRMAFMDTSFFTKRKCIKVADICAMSKTSNTVNAF